MALIQCPYCGQRISDRASQCPHCGSALTCGASNNKQTGMQSAPYEQKIPTSPNNWNNTDMHQSASGGNKNILWIVACVVVALGIGGYFVYNRLCHHDEEESRTNDLIEKELSAYDAEGEEVEEEEEYVPIANKPPHKARVYAHSDYHLGDQAGNTYFASNVVDGIDNTCWAVNIDEVGLDYRDLLALTLDVNCDKISHLIISNGYVKNQSSFTKNSRPSYIVITNANTGEVLFSGALNDSSTPQVIYIPTDKRGNSNLRSINITIPRGKYFSGTKYRDLCLSEIEVYGY